ncbi:hypothetical protein PC118_g662 [Phytophthora cactorum]|uniref:Retrotransposon gag domain-containing protein n=4 Tax=Phytophthora cactorum TaxID=29920 RepID=A0A8T1EUI8_9STRA|nr:hypothetical protein PC112_g815 [Phytophthora cactorum]KAG2935315.1 hypothetical protein PC114_g653 [Phytophthora cactorum]KAG2955232.1 hypothetical protein PC117_g585 [Phytophthora cactorum]KAG2999695.1 hypothetical protein PC118_g662 [Phytophthora cactorum]KAG3040781.1 hypothetical protein PC119_g1204 [Phytophthora cactorum]
MAKGSTTVPATLSKSGGACNESSSPNVTAARLGAVSELSVSFEDEDEHGPDAQNDYNDYEDKTLAPEPGAGKTPETATLSSGLSGATKSLSMNLAAELDDVARPDPDYDDFNDGTEGSEPSVASAKRLALLNAPRPPTNGDTPAAKRVFDRVEALMKNDEWMQLFKSIPKGKADWMVLANELQYPVNSVSTSQVAEDSVSLLLALGYENETYPSTMSLQDWSPHEAGAALQKWKKKLRKAFGAIGINERKQPVSRMATLEEDPSKAPLPPTPKRLERTPPTKRGADRDAFGTADASPYLQDSHMMTPRSTSRMRRMDAVGEGSRGRRGGARTSKNGSGRRQTNTDASSSDDDDLLPPAYEDPQAELTRQMIEIAALNDSDPTPRIEMASHRPLDRIKPFSGSRNKSENSIQWLRTFVYEMTGTHTEADKWCIPFELSLRDGAIHWFRQLPKKTKRTWKLLSNAFIRYYCSQFTQTALSRYYSAKREQSEHLCDYLNRLNGYARNARLQFEKGGRDAKEHVQQFLVTCGDDNMVESLYHTRVNDIHELEEIIEDVLKGKERMAKRDGSRRDRHESDRRRDDYRNTPRVTLADASLDDLLAELEGREATRSGTERSDDEHYAHEDDQDEYNHYQSDDASSDGSLSIMTTSRRLTRVNAAQLLKARTPVQTTVSHEETS